MRIPRPVINAVKEAPAADLFPVTGIERYAPQILKTHILQFDSGATLLLTKMDAPFLVICARRILLRAPDVRSVIERDLELTGPVGLPGAPGVAGAPGAFGATMSADGAPGEDGTNGKAGTKGRSATLPTIYVFGERLEGQSGAPVQWLDLALVFPGIDGGAGGAGGSGGDGGFGGRGAPGSLLPPQCETEAYDAGDGGDGGDGGAGGNGGAGGDGTDGARLIFVGPESALEQFAWIKVVNGGGRGGNGGAGGRGGRGGDYGLGADAHSPCPPGRNGVAGRDGSNGENGLAGKPGNKGTVTLITRANLDDLFV